MVALSGVAQADFVIDDFQNHFAFNTDTSTFTGALDQDALGTYSYVTTGFGTTSSIIQTNADTFLATTNQIGGNVTLTYDLTSPVDLHSSGAFPGSPLVLDLFRTVAGAWNLVVTYTSGASSASFDTIAINSATAPGPIGINGSDLGDGALASAVDQIELSFTVTSLDGALAATLQSNQASIAAVPEPASFALFGLTALGGVVAYRRKRKETQTA
jgi:hypothetical protein